MSDKWLIPYGVSMTLISLALLAGGIFTRQKLSSVRLELEAARAQLRSAKESKTDTVSLEEHRQILEKAMSLDQEVTLLRKELSEKQDALGAAPDSAPRKTPEVTVADSTPGTDEDAKDDSPFAKQVSGMFKGPEGRKMAEFSARSALQMQYGDFFANPDVDLDPELEKEIRAIITEHLTNAIIAGSGDPSKAVKIQKNMPRALREDLGEVLTEDELALWDEYEATREERMFRKQYEMQLSMIASGLSVENREFAVDIMIDEWKRVKDGMPEGASAPETPTSVMKMQRDILENSRDILAVEFNEKQLAHFDRFVSHLEDSYDMALKMMNRMTEKKE